jgi:hypothetical protein
MARTGQSDPLTQADATAGELVLFGVGDVGPLVDPSENGIDSFSELVLPTLATADVRIAQCERLFSVRGTAQAAVGDQSHSLRPPAEAELFSECGFDVVSLASNHALDFGAEALLDTLDLFRSKGIQTIGAGRNIEEARRPAFVERNGVRVAILGYCSVGRDGYSASATSPGIAPLRAHTYYEPVEYQAGLPPRVVTVPFAEDLEAMLEDIEAARQSADAVVLFNHWGLHIVPRVIADYQDAYALAAFEAGADLIIGHHAHVPKAIAVYDGKVCFHSVGNFIVSGTAHLAGRSVKRYGAVLEDCFRSLIASARITRDGVREVSFLPVQIDEKARPEPLSSGDPRFQDAVEFMEWVSEGFPHQFDRREDGNVVVTDDPDFLSADARPQIMRPPVEL